jgi:hypothetical protein
MSQTEHIETWNADGTRNGRIEKHKYEAIKAFIISYLKQHSLASLSNMLDEGENFLAATMHPGEIGYYIIKVKGDLEARGVIRKQWEVGKVQMLRLRKSAL